MNPDPFPPGLGLGTPASLYCACPVPFTCSEPMAKVFVCQCPRSQVSSSRASLGNDALIIGGDGCIQSEKQFGLCMLLFVQKPAKGIAKNIKTSVNVL